MKRIKGESNDHFWHRRVRTRSYQIFVHQRRAAEKLKRALDFDLPWLREQVVCALTVVERRSCRYCGDRLSPATFSLDHRTPVARGGSFSQENLQVVCLKCNQAKGNLTSSEYQQLNDMLGSWPKEAKADVLRRLSAGGRALRLYFRGDRNLGKGPVAARAEPGASTREFF